MIKTHIVTHGADLDGLISAEIVRNKFPYAKIHYHDYHLDHRKLLDKLSGEVVMTDISLPEEMMLELDEKVDLTWIDHHKSSMTPALEHIKGLREVGRSAAELADEFYFVGASGVAFLVGKYDTWRMHDEEFCGASFSWEDALHFQFWLRTLNKEDLEELPLNWNRFGLCRRGIDQGKILYDSHKKSFDEMAAANAHEAVLGGKLFIAINSPFNSSMSVESEYQPHHDGMMVYRHVNWGWSYSIYSDRFDCAEFAKKLGGGGHAGAAGFRSPDLMITKPQEKGGLL